MNIGNSKYWYVDSSVGAKPGRINNDGVDSYVGSEAVSGYGEGVE